MPPGPQPAHREPRGLPVIELEPHGAAPYARAEYALMYRAVGDVDSAIHRLLVVLPVPGSAGDDERSGLISEAERNLLAAWVRYLYAYDAVYTR